MNGQYHSGRADRSIVLSVDAKLFIESMPVVMNSVMGAERRDELQLVQVDVEDAGEEGPETKRGAKPEFDEARACERDFQTSSRSG